MLTYYVILYAFVLLFRPNLQQTTIFSVTLIAVSQKEKNIVMFFLLKDFLVFSRLTVLLHYKNLYGIIQIIGIFFFVQFVIKKRLSMSDDMRSRSQY